MLNFQDIIYFKCQILRKYKGGQNTKIGENSRSSCWAGAPLQRISPIIDNVSLSYSLEEQHLSPLLQKEVVQNVVKSLIMLKVHSPQNLPEKLAIIYCQVFIN
jgi:hypothetical protein